MDLLLSPGRGPHSPQGLSPPQLAPHLPLPHPSLRNTPQICRVLCWEASPQPSALAPLQPSRYNPEVLSRTSALLSHPWPQPTGSEAPLRQRVGQDLQAASAGPGSPGALMASPGNRPLHSPFPPGGLEGTTDAELASSPPQAPRVPHRPACLRTPARPVLLSPLLPRLGTLLLEHGDCNQSERGHSGARRASSAVTRV